MTQENQNNRSAKNLRLNLRGGALHSVCNGLLGLDFISFIYSPIPWDAHAQQERVYFVLVGNGNCI